MTVKSIISGLVLVGLGLMVEGSANAGFFVSGAAGVGNTDTNTTYFANPAGNGEFTAPSANLPAALAGPAASIVNPFSDQYGDNWYAGTTTNAAGTANWVSTVSTTGNAPGQGSTAIYAIYLGSLSPTAGPEVLTISLAADNVVSYVWINNSSNVVATNLTTYFSHLTTFTYTISASEITAGSNYLYIDVVNTGGPSPSNPSGLIYAGSIVPVPEPASMAMVAIGGLMGVVGFRARRKLSIA